METVYKVDTILYNTQMRTILDGVDPSCIRRIFSGVFRQRKRGQGFRKNGLYERVLSAFCRWYGLFLFKYGPLRLLFCEDKLKNRGYRFEHNYGHGNENLSVVFVIAMMLAFLVDQAQLSGQLFQSVWEKLGVKEVSGSAYGLYFLI